MKRDRAPRRTRTAFRILAVREWRRTLTLDDHLFLERLRKIHPERMREIEIGFRRWAYRGRGSDAILPVLFDLVAAGRELRDGARQPTWHQAAALQEPFIDIEALCEVIS